MKVLKKIFIGMVALLVIIIVIGFILPGSRQVERSVVIDAPACVVFAKINGLRHFNDWSPFVAVMPDATYSFEGPDFGVGSAMKWELNQPRHEAGGQTIVASTPYERVDVELDLGPEGAALATYLLRPEANGTHVIWTFGTDFGFDILGRYRGLFLDRRLGPTLAQGLTNLKRIAEELPKVDWSDIEIGITDVPSTTIAYVTGSSGPAQEEIAAAFAASYGRVVAFVAANGLQLSGPPIAITNFLDERGYGFDAGLPVSGNLTRGAGPDSPVRMGETYGGRVVRAVHVGPYATLNETASKVEAFMAAHRLQKNGRTWDSYVSDPGSTPQEELVTEVYYPVK